MSGESSFKIQLCLADGRRRQAVLDFLSTTEVECLSQQRKSQVARAQNGSTKNGGRRWAEAEKLAAGRGATAVPAHAFLHGVGGRGVLECQDR